MAPRTFDDSDRCPGAPMPASRPPGTLGICHTCDRLAERGQTTQIEPATFTHRTGPSVGTVDCTNWVPVGHVRTVNQQVEPRKSAVFGGEGSHSEHNAAVRRGNEQERAA